MHKSLKQRLEALEALEAIEAEQRDPGALTDEDYGILVDQVALQNISFDADGQARRVWSPAGAEYAARYDRALARLNALFSTAPDAPRTHADLYFWLTGKPW